MPTESSLRSRAHHLRCSIAVVLFLALGPVLVLRAGPPFLTDDPEPVDLNNWEIYVFGQGERTAEANFVSGPAIEINYGIAPNTQLHLVAPEASISTSSTAWTSGFGDTELGIKYRFVQETDLLPQIGIFPMAELATGSGARQLGNGKTWYRLPVWLQKSWGPWTTYGGGGVELNSAPGERNQGFAGWLLQRDLGEHLTLGTELFEQQADATFGRATTIANVGGYLKFTKKFNLLFSAGRSIAGTRYTVWYLGLYWTGGPEKVGQK